MSVEMVSDSTFQKSVIDASQEKLVVVEFSTVDKTTKRDPSVLNASGKMDAVIDELDTKYAGRVVFCRVGIKLNSDLKDTQNPTTSNAYTINHGPTMVFFSKGQRGREDLVGLQTQDRMVQVIEELLSAP